MHLVSVLSPARRSRLRLLGSVLCTIAVLGMAGAQQAAADSPQYAQSATALSLPAGALGYSSEIYGDSCDGSDSCVAVGSYGASGGGNQALVEQIVDGRALPAIEVPLPANAVNGATQNAYLLGVSCPASGACTAYGHYNASINSSTESVSFVVQISDGVPTTATQVTGPAQSVPSQLNLETINCPSAGNCVLAGAFVSTGTHAGEPLVVIVQDGVVQTGYTLFLPENLDASSSYAEVHDVACQTFSSCIAVGSYRTNNGAYAPIEVNIADGVPGGTGVPALPSGADPNQNAYLYRIACPVSGACESIGYYVDTAGAEQDFVVPISAGGIGASSEVAAAPDAYAGDPALAIEGLSCSSAALCVAAGSYSDDAAGHARAGVVTITPSGAGAYGVVLPADQYGASGESAFSGGSGDYATAISCAPSGPCLAAGFYQTSASAYEGLVAAISAGGGLQNGQEAPTPADATSGYTQPGGVACGASGSCAVIGSYQTDNGDVPYEISEQLPVSVTTPGLGGATQGSAYQATLAASGAWGIYSWSIPAGNLPPGLNLDPQTGVISGTPTASGTWSFTAEATGTGLGSPAPAATEQLTLTVAAGPTGTGGTAGSTRPVGSGQPPTTVISAAERRPVVRLLSSGGKLDAGRLAVKLSCSDTACAGRLRIETTELLTVRHGNKRVRKHRTLVIGTSRYTAGAGTTRTLAVTLNRAGRSALIKAHGGRLVVEILATVSGGTGASRRETITATAGRR